MSHPVSLVTGYNIHIQPHAITQYWGRMKKTMDSSINPKWNGMKDRHRKEKTREGAVEFHSYHFICLAPMMLFALLTSHSDPAQPVGFEEAAVCHQHKQMAQRRSKGCAHQRPAHKSQCPRSCQSSLMEKMMESRFQSMQASPCEPNLLVWTAL